MEKYIRFKYKENINYGLINGEKSVVILEGDQYPNLRKTDKTADISEICLLAPCLPSKVVGVGLNYKDTILEPGKEFPKNPLLFLKPSTSILEPNGKIIKWPMVKDLRYEGELAIVIGKKTWCVSEKKAMDYVWGFTIANDITAKDLQEEDTLWTRGKSFNTFLPLGPYIITDLDYTNLEITSYVNDELVQKGKTTDLLFGVKYLISYISHVMELLPGDVIITGTPGGYGGRLNPDDKVEIRIDKIGKLTNYIGLCENDWLLT